MKKQAILRAISDGITKALAACVVGLIWAEKRVFWATGWEGRALRQLWASQGDRLQKALNREHGTAIKYGYIAR